MFGRSGAIIARLQSGGDADGPVYGEPTQDGTLALRIA
jgi:hypothetical protein